VNAAPPAPPRSLPLPATLHDDEGREYIVRSVTPADRKALDRFYDAFAPKRAAQGLPPAGAARVARWLDGVLASGTHLVVEDGGRLVGHAMLMPTVRPPVREYAIFLDASIRGRGVGTEVNRLTADVARALGVERLWLSVEPQNRAAVRSYQKAGFRFRPSTMYATELEMEMELAGAA
jgi:diamine N-acetyltransferase